MCDYRASHLVMRVAPQSVDPAVSFPVIRNSHSADKSQDSVHHQNFSMGPEINAREMNEAENLHGHTGAFHQLDGAAVYSVTSERILKKMHFHTVTRAFRKRLSESVRDFAFPEEEFSNVIVRCAERMPFSIAGKI